MSGLVDVMDKLKIPTTEINSQLLQEILLTARKIREKNEITDEIVNRLWEHLMTKLATFDDQLLCSTCFYMILGVSCNQDTYLLKILDILNDTLQEENKDKKENTFYAMTLMYGLFQSSYLTQKLEQNKLFDQVLESSFNILMSKAYEYSKYTFITFKTISSFKKVIGTQYQEVIFNRHNQIMLLNVINQNWENPITGVRNLNRLIFQMLVNVLDKDILETILEDIDEFYWNKAKFLMITEIIEQSQQHINELLKISWVQGLIYSLHKPGLVSCGSDMYFAILKKLNTVDEWCKIFVQDVIAIFNSNSQKAIENFYNYWCLVTLKKFPELMMILLTKLSDYEISEHILLSSLSVMKQGNKIALLDKDSFKDYIVEGLRHTNTHIRIKAFDIVCVNHGKSLPDMNQYQVILDYLQNNINSDCTVLRINLLNSFASFLLYLHNAFITNDSHDHLNNLKRFCLKLQNLLKTSIEFNGNYQRKVTTVKLIEITFNYMIDIPSKKKSSKKSNRSLMDMLKLEDSWILSEKYFIFKLLSLLKDPADDVRQTVLNMLRNYYINDIKSPEIFNYMTDDVFNCCKSKYFYEIDCGKVIFKLIISIILKQTQTVNAEIKSIENHFKFWYHELISEYEIKRNIVDSILEGKQMYSILGMLFITFETCFEYGYKLNIERNIIMNLVAILQEISNQFICDNESVSSDFSRMNELVESLIKDSKLSTENQGDETKISGLHQVVLNSLWLNVKISCDLSALLIMYVSEEEICSKSLNTIIHVLETCRHKGAIEAAGTALGKSIQFLTSIQSDVAISKLPSKLLEIKLKELIFEAKRMASVTRRGAGLSIMVHRIVSSDMKKGKPLFHQFMDVLLRVCLDSYIGEENSDCEKDLPKAIYIHFLTKIVTDSSLASEMMFYSAKLAEIAFGNLTSPHWQIRNAALQLYGALVPKLIGQKKASGVDEETVATVACDEFRTHSPQLWTFMINQLQNINQADIIQSHSNLVPILNILANIARRYNFTYDLEGTKCYSQLLDSLKILLGSSIYTVRRLVASCIINIYSCQEIYKILIDYQHNSENELHGILILLESFVKVYKTSLSNEMLHLKDKYNSILKTGHHCYLNRVIFERVFANLGVITDHDVKNVCERALRNKYEPGVYVWANFRINLFIQQATWEEVDKTLGTILEFNDFEAHGKVLLQKLQNSKIPENVSKSIATTVITSKEAVQCSCVWQFLYEVSKNNNLVLLEINQIENILNNAESIYKMRYIIPLASRIFANSNHNTKFLWIFNKIFPFCDPSETDVDLRYIAAIAYNEIACVFQYLPDIVKILSIKCALILLQDEDEDIRNVSTKFYYNIKKERNHAFLCICKILSKEFMDSVLAHPKAGIKTITTDLRNFMSSMTIVNRDSYNPFVSDSKNIYLEENVMITILNDLKKKYE